MHIDIVSKIIAVLIVVIASVAAPLLSPIAFDQSTLKRSSAPLRFPLLSMTYYV
jgi:hypothetical protein